MIRRVKFFYWNSKKFRLVMNQAWSGGFKRHVPPELNRRQRLLFRVQGAMMYYEDALPLEWESERWYDVSAGVKWVIGRLCRAHVPENDQCGMPAHRFCMICEAATPDGDVTLARSLTWRN